MYAVRFETDVLHEAQLLAFDRITRVLIAVASSNTEEVTCEVCRNHISEVTSKHLLESE